MKGRLDPAGDGGFREQAALGMFRGSRAAWRPARRRARRGRNASPDCLPRLGQCEVICQGKRTTNGVGMVLRVQPEPAPRRRAGAGGTGRPRHSRRGAVARHLLPAGRSRVRIADPALQLRECRGAAPRALGVRGHQELRPAGSARLNSCKEHKMTTEHRGVRFMRRMLAVLGLWCAGGCAGVCTKRPGVCAFVSGVGRAA